MNGINNYLDQPMSDEEWRHWWRRCARVGRGMLVSGLLWLAFLMIGVPSGKAFMVAFAVVGLYLLNIGARWLEKLAFIGFVLTVIGWLDLVPLHRWITAAFAAIDRGIGCGMS